VERVPVLLERSQKVLERVGVPLERVVIWVERVAKLLERVPIWVERVSLEKFSLPDPQQLEKFGLRLGLLGSD
jgi:hypothetical protein